MSEVTSPKEKPKSEVIQAHLTRFPRRVWWRRLIRGLSKWLARLLIWIFLRIEKSGLENIPQSGPALIVSNHLGDADFVLLVALGPRLIEAVGKIELYDLPILGKFLDTYGIIWVHRGQADRRAIRAVLNAFKEQCLVAIAPEGRESITGSLEEGTGGAAYLALKGNVPLIPVTITGTENSQVFPNMKKLKRTDVTLTVGAPFLLDNYPEFRQAVHEGTEKIMQALARQLPPEYRGYYREDVEQVNERV